MSETRQRRMVERQSVNVKIATKICGDGGYSAVVSLKNIAKIDEIRDQDI
jgi:hypothetical protein